MKEITPIIDQLYWKVSGDEYQLIRQTQASETVFFIATQAEYEAITNAANYEAARVEDAKRIAELTEALNQIVDDAMNTDNQGRGVGIVTWASINKARRTLGLLK